jgi:predicted ATPase/DNA-binding SARP family transcriptional activator
VLACTQVCALFSVRVLGPIEAWADTRQVQLGGHRQFGLFALLALNANHAVSSDRIIDAIWGDAGQGAGKSLQMTVARIRKALAEADVDAANTLRTVSRGYLLNVYPGQLDHERFAELIADGQRALDAGDPVRADRLLAEALALWRGPPLTEVAFDDFAQVEIRRLEELRVLAVEARADARLGLGRHAELVSELNSMLVQHPDREGLASQLMLALYRCGRQNDALDIYQRLRVHLADTVGLTPGPGIQRLEQQILEQDPALAAPTSPAHAGRTPDADVPANWNLPEPESTLIGRGQDIETIRGRLGAGIRLLTLTGSGGIGKTRLAIETARQSGRWWRDGVRFVELAALADPDLVGTTVADVVGVGIEPGADAAEAVASELADRELLLVLDNCEHVLTAATELVELILSRCPQVAVLATSRETLLLEHETSYRVPSLSVPEDDRRATSSQRLERAGAEESVRLLVTRGRARDHEFSVTPENLGAVVAVCRHLDGIPLAIELAASRLRTMSIDDLSARLDRQYGLLVDRSRRSTPRHQTVTALLDWSYDLLSPAEQELFARLSVFAGGFDLDAVEQICVSTDRERFGVADRLSSLVDKSLVQDSRQNGTARYRMLEPVREYGETKLTDQGSDESDRIKRAHRDHYLALAETINARFQSSAHRAALNQMGAELDNLRVAHLYSLQDPDPEPGLRLVIALNVFSHDRGHVDEQLRAFRSHLSRPESASPTRLRSDALRRASTIADLAGTIPESIEFTTEALTIGRELGDDEMTARALNELGYLRFKQQDLDAAQRAMDEALALARPLGNTQFTAAILIMLGEIKREQGDDAASFYAEALKLHRSVGNKTGMASALGSWGDLLAQNGDLAGGRAHMQEALEICTELNIPGAIVTFSGNLARIDHQLGDDASARTFGVEAVRIAHELQMLHPLTYAMAAFAPSLTAVDPVLAAGIYGAADQLAEQIGLQFEYIEAQARAAGSAELQQQLGDTAFGVAYSEGQRASRADLIARAAAAVDLQADASSG